MAHEPAPREVWEPGQAGRKEDPASVGPGVGRPNLALSASGSLALPFSAVSPSPWHRAWHTQGAPGIFME